MSIILPANFTPVMPYNRRDNYTIRNDYYFVTISTELLMFLLTLLILAFSLYKAYHNINQDKIGVEAQPRKELEHQQLFQKNDTDNEEAPNKQNHVYNLEIEDQDDQQDGDQNYEEEEQQVVDSSNQLLQQKQNVVKLQTLQKRLYGVTPVLAIAFLSIFNFSADLISGILIIILIGSAVVFGLFLHGQLCVNIIPYLIGISIIIYHLCCNQKMIVQSYTQNKIG